ncbi:Shedu immune nuclease family protein [Ralstonia sp. L16]|uniref:Shedu immune nuclease family protein n=1 Tax=Ralstonia sp. L16 TaxID=3423950 RepID=UPI003F7AF8F8
MLDFRTTAAGVELHYHAEFGPNRWVWDELKTNGEAWVSRVFLFQRSDLLNPPTLSEDFDAYVYRFRFCAIADGYMHIPGRVLDIDNDVLIDRDVTLKRAIFAAERNISIFGRLSDLLEHSDPIVIGGSRPGTIPREAFEELLRQFPGSHELDLYAGARVQAILSEHLDGMKDARGRYEQYLNRKASLLKGANLDLSNVTALEGQKYALIRDLIADALQTKTNLSERQWQQLMLPFLVLLFPKYIKVLQNITIHDYYSDPGKKKNRYVDIGLVDANGNLDIVELKRPFDEKIFCKGQYRGNSVPTSELSGTIMQAEKYLFHLSKWGVRGEEILSRKYSSQLPEGMKIRISNPKAIIIVGRDQIGGTAMNGSQLLDFELIRRKYANMIDIITYDDLLRRLTNTIAALTA